MNNTTKDGQKIRTMDFNGSEAFIEQTKIWMQKYKRLMAYYKCAIMEIETKFDVLSQIRSSSRWRRRRPSSSPRTSDRAS